MIDAVEDFNNDPRIKRAVEYVARLRTLQEEFGLKPTEAHVNPGDVFLTKIGTICGLRIVHDYTVPRGNIIIL